MGHLTRRELLGLAALGGVLSAGATRCTVRDVEVRRLDGEPLEPEREEPPEPHVEAHVLGYGLALVPPHRGLR
jgi:hypothetical protein